MSGLKIGGIQLTNMDMYSLGDGEFLNDNVLNMYLTLLREKCEEKQVSAFIAGTHLFTKIRKGEGVNWYKKQSILVNDWIYIPIHYNSHWSVLVCCNLRSYLLEKTYPTIKRGIRQDRGNKAMFSLEQLIGNSNLQCHILSFDSLGKDYSKALNSLAKYVVDRWVFEVLESGYTGASLIDKEKLTKQFIGDLQITKARVPSQQNGYDCGGFMLHYIELLSHPETLKVVERSKNVLFWAREGFREWFSPSDAEAKRKYIVGLFSRLLSLQETGAGNVASALLSSRYVQSQVATAIAKITNIWKQVTKSQQSKREIYWEPDPSDDDTSGCSAFSESDNETGDILPVRERPMTDEEIERSVKFNAMLMRSKGGSQSLLPSAKKPTKKRTTKKDATKQTTLSGFVTSPLSPQVKRPKPDIDEDAKTESSSSDSDTSSSSCSRKRKVGPVQALITSFCSKNEKQVKSAPQQKLQRQQAKQKLPTSSKPTSSPTTAVVSASEKKQPQSEPRKKPPPKTRSQPTPLPTDAGNKEPVAIIKKTITPKEDAKKVNTSKEDANKVNTSKEDSRKASAPKGGTTKKVIDSDDQMTDSDNPSPRNKPEQRRVKKRVTTERVQNSPQDAPKPRTAPPRLFNDSPHQSNQDWGHANYNNPYATLSHLNRDGENRPSHHQSSYRRHRGDWNSRSPRDRRDRWSNSSSSTNRYDNRSRHR
eukprot:TRINITY_DN4934_c0_g1_i1.p1 TRINITY_DN4934_c0_g1~~TRINITY_DN4934_c0_g1_i1.p1  ORF type:complete len:704 (+),score=116.79 TRINITY_DN4934_c0_g1_i1:160-2271(+)